MRHERQGSDLSHNEAATEQTNIERAAVIVRANILCGPLGKLAGLSASDIRAIVCASLGFDIRDKSPEYIRGAFDTLIEQRQPLPRHDLIAR